MKVLLNVVLWKHVSDEIYDYFTLSGNPSTTLLKA